MSPWQRLRARHLLGGHASGSYFDSRGDATVKPIGGLVESFDGV